MKILTSETMTPLRTQNRLSRGCLTIGLALAITVFLVVLLISRRSDSRPELAPIHPDNNRDMLAYTSNDNHLMLYDPRTRTETTLLENVGSFVLGQDGRVAFTRSSENDAGLYVFDPSKPASELVTVSQSAFAYPLGWSPDGHYLAFRLSIDANAWSYQTHYGTGSRVPSLYVWDGETITDVMPDEEQETPRRLSIDWSNDGRLAFTIDYDWSKTDFPAEIYLWDGTRTSNLSQNPDGPDESAEWSPDGQLMFNSRQSNEGGFYIWDGVSLKDGSPNRSSFIRVAPELKPTSASWIKAGLIGLTAAKELVVWDVSKQAVIERRPISSQNGESRLTEGGQAVLSARMASGIPSAYLDVENTRGEILFSSHVGSFAWSPSGYLAYCGIENSISHLLSIWDGMDTWVVASVSYKTAQWQQGQEMFSCNNG